MLYNLAFFRAELGPERIVVDIGAAHEVLKTVLKPLNYANLDETFPGELTTTEWLARRIHDRLSAAAKAGELGVGSDGIERIRVTLNESHVARAWYEGAP